MNAPETTEASTPKGKKTGRRKGSTGGIRINSLWPALQTKKKREQVCQWIFAEGLSQAKCLVKIEQEFGLHTSQGALRYFIHQHSFPWKVDEAKMQARIEKGNLPRHWEARVREALAQRKFVAVFKDLTARQLAAFEKMELEQKKIDLKASQMFLVERRLNLMEKKLEAGPETAESRVVPAEEEQRRIRKALGRE